MFSMDQAPFIAQERSDLVPVVAVIGRGRRLSRRAPPAGPVCPAKVFDALSHLPRPTAERRAVLCRPGSVAASVTMQMASRPPRFLLDNKCQPVTAASGTESGR